MEIGHNVMHGQYDWMGDPGLNSRMYEWDTVCPSEQWKHSHNYIHHTYTNILGKDRDIGYGILRMDEDQPWRPYYLGNPVYAFLLMTFFQWGVLLHDLEVERIAAGERTWADTKQLHGGMIRKVRNQTLKDYVLFPALTGPLFPLTLAGNATANLIRNIWTFNIIFCGHFPAGVETLHRGGGREGDPRRAGTTGSCSARRTSPAASCSTSSPATCRTRSSTTCSRTSRPGATPRSPPEIQASASKYGLDYNTGPLHKQLGSVAAKIVRFAVPPRASRRDATPVAGAADRLPASPCATASSVQVARADAGSSDRTARARRRLRRGLSPARRLQMGSAARAVDRESTAAER